MNSRKLMLALAVIAFAYAPLTLADHSGRLIQGAGTTIVTGGTGAPDFVPVITKFGIHWRNGQGRLECLALAPSAKAGDPESGNFDTNVMYVTGTIESVEVRGKIAELRAKLLSPVWAQGRICPSPPQPSAVAPARNLYSRYRV